MRTKEKLSARERYLAVFRHEEADRVPVDLCTNEGFRYPGEPWRRGPLDRVEAILSAGGDPCLDVWLPPESFHPDVTVRRGTCGKSDDGYPLIFTEYDTPAGALRQVVRESDDWRDERNHQLMQLRNLGDSVREDWDVHLFDDWNGPRYVESPVTSLDDVEKLKYLLRVPEGDALARWREEAQTVKTWAQERGLLLRARRTFCAEAGMWLMRFEDFLVATVSDPTFVEALAEVVGEWQIKRAEPALEIGVDVLMHRGYYETPDYFSPEAYERFCRPFIEKLGKMAREAGALFALQRSEGNTRQVDVVKEMPIDILHDVEPGIGGEDLGKLKKELAGKTTLWGGVDSTLVINRGSPEDIDRAVREAIALCAAGGGFVIMPVAWIEPEGSFEKIRTAVDAVKRYGAYS